MGNNGYEDAIADKFKAHSAPFMGNGMRSGAGVMSLRPLMHASLDSQARTHFHSDSLLRSRGKRTNAVKIVWAGPRNVGRSILTIERQSHLEMLQIFG
jgi:hypothetical protein